MSNPPPSRLSVAATLLLVWFPLAGASGLWGLPSPAHADPPPGDRTYYSKQLGFLIPFETDPGERRIREVQLYVSEDQGRTWQQASTASPNQRKFSFTARRDGWYAFTVRTIDTEDRAYPTTLDQATPRLKVCVDTQAPVVSLRAVQSPNGAAAVEWDIRDDNLDVESLQLEYRPPGGSEWSPLAFQKGAAGQRAWNPETNATLDVRLRARDLAGNTGEATTTVTPGRGGSSSASPMSEPVAGGASVRMVNSKRISINYEIKDVGKSGIAVIELWYTRTEGRNWQKYEERPNPQPPYTFEVNDEGLYGFTLVARNRAGGGEQPPKVGDLPQVWVEVDLTKPLVRIQAVDVGKGAELGNLTITYNATDKNLARQAISLSYAEKPDGEWKPIATNEENTGRYVWRMPADVPYQFYVRVEATDRAGNTGSAETAKPVIVDLSQPKVQVIGVEPGGK
jgi:hypothetical protein